MRCHAQHAAIRLQGAHARATGGGVGPLMRLASNAPCTPLRKEKFDHGTVFAGNDRDDLPRMRAEGGDLVDQAAERVDEMNPPFRTHQRHGHLAEEAAFCKVPVRALRQAKMEAGVEKRRYAEGSGIKDPANLAIPGLPTPVLVDQQAQQGIRSSPHECTLLNGGTMGFWQIT